MDYKRGEAYTFHEGFSAHLVGGKESPFLVVQNEEFGVLRAKQIGQIKSAQSW